MSDRLTRREFVRDSAVGAAALAAGMSATVGVGNAAEADTSKIMNYNADMEYRRCGKTDWMISAVCLGGHWKRVNLMVPGLFEGKSWLSADLTSEDFHKNRYEVVSRCIERGINYIDACTSEEIQMYSKALKGRRDKMHLGWSWYQQESRRRPWRSAKKLTESLDQGMKRSQEEYVDLWRITCLSNGEHSEQEAEWIAEALTTAKKAGKARMTGISSHNRTWLSHMMKTYPEAIDVVVTPYTAKSKVLPEESFFDDVKKCDCGFFGIKPFAGTSLFEGDSSLDSPTAEKDDRLARLAMRYILHNPSITAPIPGMINEHQVDNVALAVAERRELDTNEKAELDRAMDRAWANLPYHYRWLKDWEWV